jgi:DNA-binding HxlR family transcriptional regulator
VVLREAFFGVRKFEDFQHNLTISRSVLTKRLKHLVEHGIFERRCYQSRPPRYEYRLTEKGRSMYSIMVALMEWGDRWLDEGEGPPLLLVHGRCGHRTSGEVVCTHCHEPLEGREMSYMLGPGSDPGEVAALAGGVGTHALPQFPGDGHVGGQAPSIVTG